MRRCKIPEGELVNFIVKTRYYSSQTGEFQRHLALIRNMANRVFRDHIGYTLTGEHRLKEKGDAVFAAAVAREKKRLVKPSRTAEVKSFLRYLGDGSFLWEGNRTVVLGIPPALRTVDKVDFVLADRFTPALREPMLELLRGHGATLVGLPEIAAEASLRGLPAIELHVGGSVAERGISFNGIHSQSTEGLAPLGFVAEMDGSVVYHTGRSALTSDMEIVGDLFRIDAMMLPLGARVPMSEWAAARAVELVSARWVLPWAAEDGVYLKDLQKHLGDTARVKLLGPNERWEVQ